MAVPGYFRTTTSITGLDAKDLFALNTMLGATIEQQLVETLNSMREVWDPGTTFGDYRFERYSQTFPDVRLPARTPTARKTSRSPSSSKAGICSAARANRATATR